MVPNLTGHRLKQPKRTITGIGGLAGGLGGKWLELIKQTVPEVSRVGVLYTRFSERVSPMMKELEVAARSLGVELQPGELGMGERFANIPPNREASRCRIHNGDPWAS